MRLAIFSDIHGNSIALDAVLQDIEAQGGVDGCWILGDFCSQGHDPVGVLERVTALPNTRFVRGNTDRYVATGALPPPSLEDGLKDFSLLPVVVEIAASFAWTRGSLARGGWLDWLEHLPLEQRVTLPDGTRVLALHATPQDDTTTMHPRHSDADFEAVFGGCEAELILYGHIHWPFERQVGAARIVNVGSVSLLSGRDVRASYVLLDADDSGYWLAFRRVAYDVEAVIRALEVGRYPAIPYLLQFLRGEYTPLWERG